MVRFIKKYKHGLIILAYAIVYMIFFNYLEHRPIRGFHVIDTVFDDHIPFCEYFIVPYLLWFPYQIITVLYFIFRNKNKKEYYQLISNMMMGMTIFLIVSYVYPNVLHLRPAEFPRENVFTDMVKWLYRTDTPTNVLPSIHVFNSLAVHMSLTNCESLRGNKKVKYSSLILTLLIIMSTMFLKQHSVIDVCCGATLALFGYLFFYPQKSVEEARDVAVERLGRNNHRKR
nr:phosphatase PAP2 family protein [uncultured Blautia sp.]